MKYGDSVASWLKKFTLIALVLAGFLVLAQCGSDNPVDSPTAQLLVWPLEVSLSAVEEGADPDHVLIRVDCDPHGNIGFAFNEDCSWMSLSNLAGTNNGITRDSFSVLVSINDLEPGVYVDTAVVTCSDAANSPQYVEVTLTVDAITPELQAWPPRLDFESPNEWDEIDGDTIFVSGNTDDSYTFTAEHGGSWFTLSKTSGATPDTILLDMDMTGITSGASVDTVYIYSDDVANSPRTVVCSLWIPPWQVQESALTAQLTDVVFSDEQNGWAVGLVEDLFSNTGFIMSTSDGGITWLLRYFLEAFAGDEWGFTGLCAFGGRVWTVGQSGIIRVSDDMGATWAGRSTGLADTLVTLYDIEFGSADVGWIVGDDGLVLKTIDGGNTWVEKPSGVAYSLTCLDFVDELNGWAAGSGSSVIRTTDGGETWIEHSANGTDYWGISFVDASTGWISGENGTIAHTTDAGQTWSVQTTGINTWLYDILFVDAVTGWACGQDGVILYTEDGGITWSAQESATGYSLFAIHCLNTTKGWIVGNRGTIRYTSSAGNP